MTTTNRAPSARSVESGLALGDTVYDFTELNERVGRISVGLAANGVGPGSRVGVLLYNDTAHIESMMATAKCGATPVPVNYHSSAEVVAHVVRSSRAQVLIAHRALLDKFADAIPDDITVVIAPILPEVARAQGAPAGPVDADADSTWAQWMAADLGELPAVVEAGRSDVAPDIITYTSGTTGMPKGVRRVFHGVPIAAVEQAKFMGIKPGLRHVVTGPMYHAAPGSMALNVIRQGGLVVLQAKFDPEDLLGLVERHRITYLNIVPTMMVRLLALPRDVRNRYDLSSIERVVHGAGPCSIPVKQAMIDWLGPVIYEYYGGTEAGALTYLDSSEALAHPGSVGRAMVGVTMRVLDEKGGEVPRGEIGEIFARNDAMPDFEYIDGEETRREIDRDGFITQGDLGYVDDDGYLYLAGRVREMIVSGGVNIYCAEIEESLYRIPEVRAAAAFAVPDAELGEAVGVALELASGAVVSAEEVRRHVAAELGSLKRPAVVEFTDELTRSDVGKVFKKQLAEKYWQQA